MVPKITTNKKRKIPLKSSRRMVLRKALGEASISARKKERQIADPKIELFLKNQF